VSALETRRAKREVPIDRLRADWRARALEHGFDDQSIAAIFDSPAQVEPTGTVLDKLTEDVSAFGRPEVLQAVAQSRRAGATVDELERHVAAVLADSEIVRLASGPAPGGLTEPRFSTREMLATERALIEGAIAKRYSMTARVNEFVLGDVLRERSNLSDEQRRAVRELCGERGGVVVLRAAAGTGKTFALDAAREAWAHSGVEVVGCALSARAALELHDQSGIPAFTIAALRDRIQHGHELPRGAVLVVDEAGMVGTRALAALADAASRANAKLVLVGDDHQLPEIQAGGGFRALAERLGAVELREIRRQREAWDRAALDALRRGDIERWARAYRDRSRITIASRANDARAALVNDWYRADGDKLMIAARREDVRDLNDRARQLLKADGRLGPDELHAAGRGYAVGDRVVGRRNDRLLGILNGQRGTIEEIDREPMTIRVALDGGKTAIVDHRYLDAGHLDYGYAITAHRAQGATVDRAFVLGSDELYREWGYTALSRHRHEARFYVTRADLDLDRDAAPERDPIIRGIERLLGRSKAKELAIDGLADADALELSRERDALAGQFREDPPPHANRAVGEEVSQTAGSLDDARRRRSVLERDRDALPWYRRRERAELDPLLERNAIEIQWRSEAHTRARRAHDAATDAQIAWLDTHGSDAERLLAVDSELRARQRVNNEVDRRVDRFHAEPSPHNRDLPLPEIHHDLGHDLDIGL
jgi:Ti-type conjugative transfer relaxase TraA